jgi:hypothetical protein
MSTRSTRSQRKLAEQALGLSLAVPQVVAHRVSRMAAASTPLSARDRREFTLMGAEKMAAFYESWAAMGQATLRAQQAMLQSMWRSAALMPIGLARPGSLLPTPAALTAHAMAVAAKGLAPVHRRQAVSSRGADRRCAQASSQRRSWA